MYAAHHHANRSARSSNRREVIAAAERRGCRFWPARLRAQKRLVLTVVIRTHRLALTEIRVRGAGIKSSTGWFLAAADFIRITRSRSPPR